MPKLELSEEEIQQVRYIYCNSLNHKTRQHMHFLLLKSKNYTNETIPDILDVNIKSTFNWTVIFRECQLQALANLNLIERLWRFMKKDVLYNKFYSDFENFKHAIIGCINKIQTGKYEKELPSLLALRFQTFDICKISP